MITPPWRSPIKRHGGDVDDPVHVSTRCAEGVDRDIGELGQLDLHRVCSTGCSSAVSRPLSPVWVRAVCGLEGARRF